MFRNFSAPLEIHEGSNGAEIGHYISDNAMYKMSFRQFHSVSANLQRKSGGYTAARQLEQNDLDVWAKALALPDTGADLTAKGTPTLVQTAVASGVKFKFAFEDGSTVIVWQSWGHAVSIVNQS
jgi:hypothetical protein